MAAFSRTSPLPMGNCDSTCCRIPMRPEENELRLMLTPCEGREAMAISANPSPLKSAVVTSVGMVVEGRFNATAFPNVPSPFPSRTVTAPVGAAPDRKLPWMTVSMRSSLPVPRTSARAAPVTYEDSTVSNTLLNPPAPSPSITVTSAAPCELLC